jgi:hypothetical protein
MKKIATLCFVLAMFAGASSLKADVTYTYTGQDFTDVYGSAPYSTSDHLSGWISEPTPLAPGEHDYVGSLPDFSFTDGRYIIDSANSGFSLLDLFVEPSGQIDTWFFILDSTDAVFGSCESVQSSFDCSSGVQDFTFDQVSNSGGENFDSPGTWRLGAIPEPASAALLGSGLIGIVGLLGDRKRQSFPIAGTDAPAHVRAAPASFV